MIVAMAVKAGKSAKARDRGRGGAALLKELNAVTITKRELLRYLQECNKQRDRVRDERDAFVLQSFAAVRVAKNDADRAMALMSRTALAALVTHERGAPGWTMPIEGGGLLAQDTLFAAAASEPLVRTPAGEFGFNRQRFLDRALALAEAGRSH
jgi:hypothetical protein